MVVDCIVSCVATFINEYIHSTIFLSICILNPIIMAIYCIKYKDDYIIFLSCFGITLFLHLFAYIVYITRPVSTHPNYSRRLLRLIFPKRVWRVILCRCIYNCMKNRIVFFHIVHMLNMVFFTLYYGIFIITRVVSKYNDDKVFVNLTSFVICSSIYLSIDILILEFMILIALIPAFAIGGVIYLCSLFCCPGFAGYMRRYRNRQQDENSVDRDFFREFQSGQNWQQMLLYIFKNNRIVFKKEDFRSHYVNEMREENKEIPSATNNNMEEAKISIFEEVKNSKNESTNMEVPPGDRNESCELGSGIDGRISTVFQMKSQLKTDQKKTMKDMILEIERKKKEMKKENTKDNQEETKVEKKNQDFAVACTICQEDFEEGQNVLQLECGKTHLFHFTCLKEWMKFKFICPTCRMNLQVMYRCNGNKREERYLYAEDMLEIQRERNKLLNEIEKMEQQLSNNIQNERLEDLSDS